ncbi:hypothetical protein [Rufibacter ruber]|uniref:hypothetical protein n=1 Tax=Rufibacter ruber TaxID=1783499 RepID=UPI00082D7A57|nr:hypothetical protein [Rufibacter ruber]
MTPISSYQQRFVYSSFRERYYTETNQFPKFSNFNFTSTTGFDRYDATYEVAGKPVLAEFKIRDCASTQYPTAMIEIEKYDFLVAEAKKTGRAAIFQCYYTDGIVLFFNLSKMPKPEAQNAVRTKSTMAANSGRRNSPYYALPVEAALKFRYKIPSEAEIQKEFYQQYTVV